MIRAGALRVIPAETRLTVYRRRPVLSRFSKKPGGLCFHKTSKIEKIEIEPGKSIDFDEVLMVAKDGDVQVGAPALGGAKVTGEVLEQGRHKKIEIIKFRRRKHHQKRTGHRQYYTAVRITGISA